MTGGKQICPAKWRNPFRGAKEPVVLKLSLVNSALVEDVPQRAGDADGGIAAADDADANRERKVPNGADAQNQQHDHHNQSRDRGVNRTGHGVPD